MKVGDMVKVHLPGETPWAECLAVNDDGSFVGRIDNELIGSADEAKRRELSRHWFGEESPLPKMHDYKFNDVLLFVEGEHGWETKGAPGLN